MEALEVGYLGRKVLDPARLDPQFFDRTKARLDRRIGGPPAGFVAPVHFSRRGEDDRRERPSSSTGATARMRDTWR
jgi:hypothetical protein